MYCPKCHYTSRNPEHKFCGEDGTKMEDVINCPKCGNYALPDNKFCTFCGANIEGIYKNNNK